LGGGGYRWGRGNIINHPMKVYSTELDRPAYLNNHNKKKNESFFLKPRKNYLSAGPV